MLNYSWQCQLLDPGQEGQSEKNMKNSCQVQQTRPTLRLKACNTQECGYKSNCRQEEIRILILILIRFLTAKEA